MIQTKVHLTNEGFDQIRQIRTGMNKVVLFFNLDDKFYSRHVDVYDAIPTIVTTFVAIIAKISIFILLLQLFFRNELNIYFTNKFTILINNRNCGFILLALGISSVESTQAFIFYLTQYSISNLNAFVILIAIGFSLYCYISENKEHEELMDKNNSPAKRSRKLLYRVLWPNSGDVLKLLVPSCSRKATSGSINH
ncbi:unnamed protein product [Fusarium graminearum]|nr:unnamed protein product [Fusarium graminearum]